jgi:AraC-like DNA-binding protein
MSERERQTYMDCITKIQQEIERPIDKFSRRLICQNIELLLDYCLRFYDRQFITREEDNHDVLVRFEKELNTYFNSETGVAAGLPTVKYFAEKCFLSPNYFGDLVKKETGKTPQEYIQMRVIDKAKEWLANTDEPVTQIAYKLGFDYSQHFSRYFKRIVGMTPTEYRLQQAV